MFKFLSLRRSKRTLQHAWYFYRKKKQLLSKTDLENFENQILALKQATEQGDEKKAEDLAKNLDAFCKTHFPKTWFSYIWELFWAFAFALIIATIVRQMWFEPYEIPTGSMRPTFKEQDHLTVSKTAFGINIPLKTEHFYFDPDLVQRTGVVIFTADNLDMRDSDTTYFGLFPAKKRLIKRLIAKPGDTLYFYGGKIYGIDSKGNEIKELLDSPWMSNLEHIPFISFEGNYYSSGSHEIVFTQMHEPVGRLTLTSSGTLQGEVKNENAWVKDQPKNGKTLGDIWGMGNFAMARLLTKEQVLGDTPKIDAPLYLEIRHHPGFSYPQPRIVQEGGMTGVLLTPQVSIIPLQQPQLEALMQNMYTSRFVVKNGRAQRYSFESQPFMPTSPRIALPDGTYEFYFGKAYSIGWGGNATLLPPSHSIYKLDNSYLQTLFNLGIEFDTTYAPHGKTQAAFPHRYAYFRNGDLYVMGGPILKKEDPALAAFVKDEEKKAEDSTPNKPYLAFVDQGPPTKEVIQQHGLKIQDKNYLVLGDNHAMSGDSRVFGTIPEENLQGAPSLIIWPPGERLGFPKQKPYPILVWPRLVIWAIAGFILALWYFWHRHNQKITLQK